MSSPAKDIFEAARIIAQRILAHEYKEVLIISHIDADGLTAASIASLALSREKIPNQVKFVKQLDETVISELSEIFKQHSKLPDKQDNNGTSDIIFWFTDLGSGMAKEIQRFKPIITDHHAPSISNYDIPVKARTDLLEFSSVLEHQLDDFHLNPHLFNLDGTTDISGAGTVYLVAKEMNEKNVDLAYLAVIGAVGDLQDSKFRQLTGTNRKILKDAEEAGKIKTVTDISSFGRESRRLPSFIQYSTDPYFPGLTMNEANCFEFFNKLDIPLKSEGRIRHWVDLSKDERKKVLSELMELLLSKGIGHKDAKRLLADVYTLPGENISTTLHDTKEFATLLNSCGKYNKPEVGFNVCLGDRAEYLNRAYKLLKGHKSILVEGMQLVGDSGVLDYGSIQYFDAGDKIPDNIVGTIAGMVLGNNNADNDKPLFGFALSEDGDSIKVSARATRALLNRGLNLSTVMKRTAESIGNGSVGGGHDIAAGATIPLDKLQEFLKLADEIVKKQLSE